MNDYNDFVIVAHMQDGIIRVIDTLGSGLCFFNDAVRFLPTYKQNHQAVAVIPSRYINRMKIATSNFSQTAKFCGGWAI